VSLSIWNVVLIDVSGCIGASLVVWF